MDLHTGDDLMIGQLADAAGVSVETVRYYERRGLLAEPNRSASGYRLYGSADLERLRFLLRAKDLGFTLAEIGELFAAAATHSTADVSAAVHAKLDAIDAQLADLARTRCRLRQLVELCDHGDGAACLQLRLVAS
ncbi:MAG: MerR family transcriptional regulator [Acidimicrobiales bacterium]